MGDEQDADTALVARGGGTVAGRWVWLARGVRVAAVAVLVAVVLGLAALAWVSAPAAYPPYTPPSGAPALSPEVAATDRAASTQAIVTTRASVLAALAGLGALVTLGINYRNSRTQLRNAEIAAQTLATTQETFRVTERGHQTGRYTAAIEQLGNTESIAIRLGGIYALEQLARDSGRPGDQATVVEVLSAFVRIAPRPTTATASLGAVGATTALLSRGARGRRGPAPDVAAALTVLGRLPHLEDVARANLAGADLAGAVLIRANFSGADLHGTDLEGANLNGANLSDALVSEANLSGAHVNQTNLSGALFYFADLSGAHLVEANLSHAFLGDADLTSANLAEATVTGAGFERADLTQADLEGAVGVVLSKAQWAVVAVRSDGTPGAMTSPSFDPEAVPEGGLGSWST